MFDTKEEKINFALDLVVRWGLIASIPSDKQDTEGRQEMRLMSPWEIAQRACSIVEELHAQMQERNWL